MKKKKKKKAKIIKDTAATLGKNLNENSIMDTSAVMSTNRINYEYLYNQKCAEVKHLDEKIDELHAGRIALRNNVITEWLQSVATINDAISHAIGEGIENVRGK